MDITDPLQYQDICNSNALYLKQTTKKSLERYSIHSLALRNRFSHEFYYQIFYGSQQLLILGILKGIQESLAKIPRDSTLVVKYQRKKLVLRDL